MRTHAHQSCVSAAVTLILTLAAATATAGAETVAVKRPLNVFDDANNTADVVERLKPNDKLDVIGHDGIWVRVRTASGKQGYVPQAALANSQAPSLDISGLTGGPTAAELSAGAAGRGLSPEATEYAHSHNLNDAGLSTVIRIRDSVSSADFKKFFQEGNVGPGRAGK